MNAPKLDLEAVLAQAIIQGYARKLARAWNSGNDGEVQRIMEYIRGSYGDDALRALGALAVEIACQEGGQP